MSGKSNKILTRSQKILNAVFIPPEESDFGSSSDKSEIEPFQNDSDCESEAPSITSDMQALEDAINASSGKFFK